MTANIRLPVAAHGELAALQAELPCVDFVSESPHAAVVDARAWCGPRSVFEPFDREVGLAMGRSGFVCIAIVGEGPEAVAAAWEVTTRYQRFIDARNELSRSRAFETVLDRHRAAYASPKPLVVADFQHALDTWQWMLRLDRAASTAAQIAALFHDVERLESEADARVEHLARDYQAFKDAHATRGAAMTAALLEGAGLACHTVDRAAALVGSHERPGDDTERALLNDADALSFFSLNATGYYDYFGPEQTRRKVAYTLSRMRPAARRRLARVRVRREIGRILADLGTHEANP